MEYLTVDEARRRMRIGRTTIYKLISDGAFPVIKIGRATRIPESAFSAWSSGLGNGGASLVAQTTPDSRQGGAQ